MRCTIVSMTDSVIDDPIGDIIATVGRASIKQDMYGIAERRLDRGSWLDVHQAAAYLGYSARLIHEWVADGRLRRVPGTGKLKFAAPEILAFAASETLEAVA
jgi:hypothetical protein